MSIASLPPVLSVAEFDEFTQGREESFELVSGVPVMSPSESPRNSNAAVTLVVALRAALPARWKVLSQVEVDLGVTDGRRTIRIPDVLVMPRSADPLARRCPAGDVALAAEIVSPSSRATDWLVKRDEYAAAGISNYLVIDPTGEQPRMALFDRIESGRYLDPHPDGTRASVVIGGVTVELNLDDLLTW